MSLQTNDISLERATAVAITRATELGCRSDKTARPIAATGAAAV